MKIPKQIIVGFDNRNYGLLGFVTSYEEGKIAQETSFNSWRDKKIDTIVYDNSPFTDLEIVTYVERGYTSNKLVRVKHPNGFFFELTISNLVELLRSCSVVNGKIQGNLVFYYERGCHVTNLDSDKCKELREAEALASKPNFKAKDLKIKKVYKGKNNFDYIYLGKFTFYYLCQPNEFNLLTTEQTVHAFYIPKQGYCFEKSPSSLALKEERDLLPDQDGISSKKVDEKIEALKSSPKASEITQLYFSPSSKMACLIKPDPILVKRNLNHYKVFSFYGGSVRCAVRCIEGENAMSLVLSKIHEYSNIKAGELVYPLMIRRKDGSTEVATRDSLDFRYDFV